MSLQLGFDIFSVLTDQDNRANGLFDEADQRRIRSVFAASSEYQYGLALRFAQCLQCLRSCVYRRGIRVVVKLYAVDLCNELYPVLDTFEARDRLPHRRRIGAACETRGETGENVFNVMQTAEKNFVTRGQHLFLSVCSTDEVTAAQEQSFVQLLRHTKKNNVCLQPLIPTRRYLIIGAQDSDVVRCLIEKNAVFR